MAASVAPKSTLPLPSTMLRACFSKEGLKLVPKKIPPLKRGKGGICWYLLHFSNELFQHTTAESPLGLVAIGCRRRASIPRFRPRVSVGCDDVRPARP